MPYKDITLYLDGSNPPPVVVVTEADTAWTFRFTVMYQNAIYAPNVNNVILAGHKPDGNAFAYTGSKSGNTFNVGCNVQMTAVPGDVLAALHLLGGGNTAIPFILRVQPAGGGTAPVASASALTAYATILNRIGNFPPNLSQYVSDWLAEHISGGETIAVDNTLTVQGAAADAKAAGDRLTALETDSGTLMSEVFGSASVNAQELWESGSLSTSDGSVPADGNPKRIRTKAYAPQVDGLTIASGYKVAILGYSGGTYMGTLSSAGTYAKNSAFDWLTGSVSGSLFNSSYSHKFVLARSDDSNIAVTEYDALTFAGENPALRTLLQRETERVGTLEGQVEEILSQLTPDEKTYTDAQLISAFVAEMNRKAALIGMDSSSFMNPSGIESTNRITAHDAVRLAVACCGNDKMCRVWGKKSYTVTTKDLAQKAVQLISSVQSTDLENYYTLLGGKTGANPDVTTYTLVAVCVVEGKVVVGAIGKAASAGARFTAMKQLMDACKDVILTGSTAKTVTNAPYAAAALLPTWNANLFERQELDWLYEQAADTQYSPASNTKCLAMLVMLEWATDLHDTVEFIASDAIGGTGAVFATGDVISYDDVLYAAMLPSSNMAVQCAARTLGRRIIEQYASESGGSDGVEVVPLPDGYQQLSYIESNGNGQYINSGIVPDNDMEIVCTFRGLYTASQSMNAPTPYGLKSDATNNWIGLYCSLVVNTSQILASFGQAHDVQISADYNAKMVTIKQSKTGIWIDGTQVSTRSAQIASETLQMYIFARNYAGTAERFGLLRIQDLQIVKNNSVYRRFVPCYRVSDGAVGMYEIKTGAFLGNSGSGSFTRGKVVA